MRSVTTQSDVDNMVKRLRDRGVSIAPEQITIKADDVLAQVGKSIPAEVLSFYLFVIGAINLATETSPIETVSWAIFIIGLVGTILYSIYEFLKEGAFGVTLKTAVAVGAFIVWSLNMGGYTKYVPGFDQLIATVALGAFSLATPLIFKIYNDVTKPKPQFEEDVMNSIEA